jgi:hypothetical protein
MISLHHKVIFVHIPKCAGQSIEKAFLRDLGLSWQDRHRLLLRPKNNTESGPERLTHLFAYEYVNFGYIDAASFKEFYKFSIVRDPIARIVSELNFRNVRRDRFWGTESVEEYVVKSCKNYSVESDVVRHLEPQVNFLFDENMEKILVDKVIHLDEIKSEFNRLKSQIGFDGLELRRENFSKSKEWLESELSKSDVNFLKEMYKADYKFLAFLKEQSCNNGLYTFKLDQK